MSYIGTLQMNINKLDKEIIADVITKFSIKNVSDKLETFEKTFKYFILNYRFYMVVNTTVLTSL